LGTSTTLGAAGYGATDEQAAMTMAALHTASCLAAESAQRAGTATASREIKAFMGSLPESREHAATKQ
jgi:hypothetical protein